ncbi:hypothetical protein D3C87_1164090 [compost metagenome]
MLFRARRQVQVAGRDFARGRADAVRAGTHFGHDAHQARAHVRHGLHQLAHLVVRGGADLHAEVAVRDGAGHADGVGQRGGDAPRQQQAHAGYERRHGQGQGDGNPACAGSGGGAIGRTFGRQVCVVAVVGGEGVDQFLDDGLVLYQQVARRVQFTGLRQRQHLVAHFIVAQQHGAVGGQQRAVLFIGDIFFFILVERLADRRARFPDARFQLGASGRILAGHVLPDGRAHLRERHESVVQGEQTGYRVDSGIAGRRVHAVHLVDAKARQGGQPEDDGEDQGVQPFSDGHDGRRSNEVKFKKNVLFGWFFPFYDKNSFYSRNLLLNYFI